MSLHHRQTIDDLLADSLIQKVMRADGVEPQALKTLLTGAAGRIAEARAPRPGVVFVGAPAERRNPLRRPSAAAPARGAVRPFGGECGSALCC